MRREIPWNWFRPGPERDRARARERRRKEAAGRRRKRGVAEARWLTLADRDADIRRLWSEGWTGPELAGRFGVSKATVSRLVSGTAPRRRYGDPEDAAYPYPRRLAAALRALADRPRPGPAPSGEVLPTLDHRRRGSGNGRSKLVEDDIARMQALRASGWSYPMLAREFKVSRSNVWYILSGTTWGHVPAEAPAEGGGP